MYFIRSFRITSDKVSPSFKAFWCAFFFSAAGILKAHWAMTVCFSIQYLLNCVDPMMIQCNYAVNINHFFGEIKMSNIVLAGETYATLRTQCEDLVKSGFLPPTVKTPEQAIAISLKGHEIGMPLMQSFSHINIISGKPAISAEGMNYLIRKNFPHAVIEIVERSETTCKIKVQRDVKHCLTEFTFTMDDAKRAMLLANPSWQKYPRAMLFARCFSEMARTIFPDAIAGVSYTPEELGANVNEAGEVIDV